MQEYICNNCGSSYEEAIHFCRKCGKPLDVTTDLLTSGVSIVDQKARIEAIDTNLIKPPRSPYVRSKTWIQVIVIACIIVGITGSIAGYKSLTTNWSREHSQSSKSALRKISYSFLVKKASFRETEQPLRVASAVSVEGGDQIRIGIAASESGFIYLVNHSTVTRPNVFDPYRVWIQNQGSDSSMISPNVEAFFPSDTWLTADDSIGSEQLWVVWSRYAVDELEIARRSSSQSTSKSVQFDVEQFLTKNSNRDFIRKIDDASKTVVVEATGDLIIFTISLAHL